MSIVYGATPAHSLDITIPGPPAGKGRPRFNRRQGRTYTPAETETAESNVRAAWAAARQPRLPDGPITLTIEILVTRPKSHFTAKGRLSAEGLRHPIPTKAPDCDNVTKLVQDALNGLAWRDDAQVADLHVTRRWSVTPRVRVTAWDTLHDLQEGDPYVSEAEAGEAAA